MIPRYFDPAIEVIFADKARWDLWRRVEIIYLQARYDEKDPAVSRDLLQIVRACQPPHRSEVNRFEGTYGHDVFAWLAAWTDTMPPHVAAQVHLGLTSSDLVDNALFDQLEAVRARITQGLIELMRELEEKADKLSNYVRAGRTHGQIAEPTAFGWRFNVWTATVSMLLEQSTLLSHQLKVFKTPGAVGSMRLVPEAVAKRAAMAWDATLLPSTQVIPRQRLVAWAAWMVSVTSLIEEIALEIRLSSRSEVGEMQEGGVYSRVGSSAMPHKKNPIGSERLSGLGRVARSLFAPIAETAGNLHNERDISNSSVERLVVPDLSHLVAFSLGEVLRILDLLKVDTDRAFQNAKGLYVDSAVVQYNLQRLGLPYVMASWEARAWAELGGWQFDRILPIVNEYQPEPLDAKAFLDAMGQYA